MAVQTAVIGAGMYGELHLQVYKQLERQGLVRLKAFAAKTAETVERQQEAFGVKGYTDYRQMMVQEQFDAVSIVTPDFLHREMAVEAAKAGKHILVEKPMDTTAEGCQEMIEAARSNGVLLQVDFHKRFDPYLKEIKLAVEGGKLGPIQYGYVHMEEQITMPTELIVGWADRTSPAWLLGIHMYDILRWILGSEARRVFATSVKRRLKELGIDVVDSIQAKIEFEGGANFVVDTSWILPENYETMVNQSIRIIGDLGLMEVDLQDRGIRACFGKEPVTTRNPVYLRVDKTRRGEMIRRGYGVEGITSFIDNVGFLLSGGKLENLEGKYPSGEDGLAATRIALAVHESAETGRIVETQNSDRGV